MKKALIVDDIKENLYLLESLLKAYGYKTIVANNGAEALGLALNDTPDIVISDILMPVMDGYTLCREWKKDDVLKNIPFVFYTATYTHPKDGEFALSLGAEKFIIKPQEPDTFMNIIEQVLSEFRNGKLPVSQPGESSEVEMLKEYNETLIRKMEDRMLKSEEAEKKIRIYAAQLEAEIEQRKKAILALKESELRFRILAESSPVGIFTTDEHGMTNYVNPRWCEIAKLSYDEAIGIGWLKAIHPDDHNNLISSWQQASLSAEDSKAEYRFVHPDGSEVWVIGHAVPQKNDQNITTGYIGTITDITERKQMEEELIRAKEKAEESDRLKSAFLANMSHEVRTPLNSIIGFSELLSDTDFGEDEKKDFIQQITSNGNNLLNIISDIIDISKFEAGEITIRKAVVKVCEMMEKMKKQHFIQIIEKPIEFRWKCMPANEDLFVLADKERLQQVLTNLLSNAIKFTSEGYIEIGYQPVNGFVEFYIKDTGIGISKVYHEKIFERFRQVEESYARKYGGNGLRLAISQNLVELMGGKIWVESELGKGATFYFTLPSSNA